MTFSVALVQRLFQVADGLVLLWLSEPHPDKVRAVAAELRLVARLLEDAAEVEMQARLTAGVA